MRVNLKARLSAVDIAGRNGPVIDADNRCQVNNIRTAQPIDGFIPLLFDHNFGVGGEFLIVPGGNLPYPSLP